MPRAVVAGFVALDRRVAGSARHCLCQAVWIIGALVLTIVTFSPACRADPLKGEATFSASGGFARLVFKLAEDVSSEVTTAGTILVIRFSQPVDIPLYGWTEAAPNYVGSARRDPDGSAIRLSLARKVTINTMTAGERVFIDMLPETWNGPPPGLPIEVVRELAERARAAERALRRQRASAETKKRAPIRVRTSMQPTFVRFVFEMPDGVRVSSVLNDRKLTLLFNAVLSFDLADAKEAAPSNIASIKQKAETDSTSVEVTTIGDVDVHSFREEKNYIVDVAFQQGDNSALTSPASELLRAPAATVSPSADAPPVPPPAPASAARPGEATVPALPEKSATPSGPPRQSGQIVQPTSETIAKEANIEIKPDPMPKRSEFSEPGKLGQPTKELPVNEPPVNELPVVAAEASPDTALASADTPDEPPPASAAGDASNGAKAARGVVATRTSDGLELAFYFEAPTPAALFRRADTVWMVFDSQTSIDLE